ncbi:MAG: M50 family metallopeptidase [Kiritimatiellaeota bacterium]|nr:M50 family metallopeptidase [Kiritimatiellota bacterium]
MKTSYTLFHAFGIPVTVDLSLLILIFMVATGYGSLTLGLTAGFILLLSILLHELGHSLVAMAFGCKVRDIRLMMLGGCATMDSMPKKAWQEILMAFAGPFVSIMLFAIAFALLLFELPPKPAFAQDILAYTAGLNLILFCFNMLPAFPMDGGRILRATLQQFFTTRLRATWIASRIGRFVAILMALHAVYSMITKSHQEFMFIRLFIALMIYQTAEREYRMVLAEEQGPRRNPFAGFPFFNPQRSAPPPDDGQAVVSPPPYSRGATRVDVHKEN